MADAIVLDQAGRSLTVTFPRGGAAEQATAPVASVAGYNLSEFSLAPLGLNTQDLAHDTRAFHWTYTDSDETAQDFFFEVTYGSPVPNAYTEDALLVLAHLMYRSGNPVVTNASIYEIIQLQGIRHKPSKTQIDATVRHLDALCAMQLHTNFAYDRTKRKWRSVRTGVLSGYSYKDSDGRVRRCRPHTQTGTKNVEVHRKQRVFELKEFSFAPLFTKYFLRDTVPIDLGVYFGLEQPTAKRLFRFGNKYAQTVGHHAMDLQLFCLSRIGMAPHYVAARRVSTLASELRVHANRVTETGALSVRVERSRTPSGYKITFDRAATQIPLFDGLRTFTKPEREAFEALRRAGVWENVARQLVVAKRNTLGRDGAQFILFAARQFHRDLVASGKLRVPPANRGGVLAKAIRADWYYPAFYERQAAKEKREWRQEHQRYPAIDTPPPAARLSERAPTGGAPTSPPSVRTPDRFKEDFPETYQAIVEAVTLQYQSAPTTLNLSKDQIASMKDNAVHTYCCLCAGEFSRGNTAFFPPILEEIRTGTDT